MTQGLQLLCLAHIKAFKALDSAMARVCRFWRTRIVFLDRVLRLSLAAWLETAGHG